MPRKGKSIEIGKRLALVWTGVGMYMGRRAIYRVRDVLILDCGDGYITLYIY